MAAVGALLLVGWMLTVYGHTLVVTHSTIMAPLRQRFSPSSFLGTLLRCPMCMGFWTGAFWAAAILGSLAMLFDRASVSTPIFVGVGALVMFAAGSAGAGLCWALHVIFARLGALQRLGIEPRLPPAVLSIRRAPQKAPRTSSNHPRH